MKRVLLCFTRFCGPWINVVVVVIVSYLGEVEFECKFFICELNIIRDLKLLKTFCVFSKNFNYTPITYLFFIAKFRTTLKFDKGLACWACCHCLSKKKDLLQRKSCKLNFEMKNKNKCVPSHRPNNIRIQPTEYSGYYIEP